MGSRCIRSIALLALCAGVLAAAASGATREQFDPRAFGKPGTNRWYPLEPGTQSVRQGFVYVGSRRLPHRRVFTVTDVTKVINGVRAVAVVDQDFNAGELAETALDFVAIDKRGNVWTLGSYTENYEGGRLAYSSDAWLAGVNGARPGLMLQGQPRPGTPEYVQEEIPGKDKSTAQVVKTGQKHCVPFKCYRGVVVIQEGSPSEPGVVEYKYFAPGVGGIRTAPQSGGEQETEMLINFTSLSARGLRELATEALRLDRNARAQQAAYSSSQAAKRTR